MQISRVPPARPPGKPRENRLTRLPLLFFQITPTTRVNSFGIRLRVAAARRARSNLPPKHQRDAPRSTGVAFNSPRGGLFGGSKVVFPESPGRKFIFELERPSDLIRPGVYLKFIRHLWKKFVARCSRRNNTSRARREFRFSLISPGRRRLSPRPAAVDEVFSRQRFLVKNLKWIIMKWIMRIS